MKKILKLALAIAAAVFVGNAAVAEEEGSTSSVTVEKSIAPTDKNNATIRIVSNVKFSDTIKTNKILLVGSLCDSHGLLAKTVRGTVNKLVEKGSVDWNFFSLGTQTGANVEAKKGVHNSQQMGVELKAGTRTDVSTGKTAPDENSTTWPYADEADDYEWKNQNNQRGYLPHSSHKVLKEMLTAVDNAIKGATEPVEGDPDYIVLEFDGSRIGEHYNANATLEDRVAKKLAWYYNNKRVIWIVDNKASGEKEPFYDEYYRPSSAFLWSNDEKHTMKVAQWEGLVALLDPVTYTNNVTGARYADKMTWSGITADDNDGPSDGTIWAAHSNKLQTNYTDLDAIKQLIEDAMKEPIYTAKASDTAASFGGALAIKGDTDISVYKWTGKSAPEAPSKDAYIADATPAANWSKITDKNEAKVSRDDNQVNVALSNLVNNSWYKLEINVKATDDLVKNAVNTKDPDEAKLWKLSEDGKTYEINPNKGDAKFTLYRDAQDGQGPQEWTSGSGAALNTWDIDRTQGKGEVVSVTKAYDGVATNIVETSLDPALADGDKIEYSCDAAHAIWTTKNPTFTDVTPGQTSVWYRVSYADPLYMGFTNTAGYVCITQRVITVKAQDATKTYGEKDPDFTCTTNGTLVGKDKLTGALGRETGDDNNVGDHAIIATKEFGVSKNYAVYFEKGTLTITRATINGYDNGTKEAKTPAWAWAEPVTIITNDTPVGDGQLIKVTTKMLEKSDSPTLTYSVDGGSTWLEESDARAQLKDLCYEKKVWCKVECDNYYSTNVWAYVTIKERITEVDKEAAGEWATKGSSKTEKTDDALMAIAKDISKDRTGWITADVKLAIVNPTAGSADDNVDKAKKAFEKAHSSMELIDAKAVVVNLMYVETTSSGEMQPEPVTDASNNKPVQFKVAFADTDNLKAIYHCHGTSVKEMKKVSKFSSSTAFPGEYIVGDGEVTLQMGQFSTLVFITADAGGCDRLYCAYAYRVKLAGKTVTGKEVTKGTVGACDYESNCWAKPTSYRVTGYIFNASLTEPAECEECECNAFDNIQTVFWTADRKQTFADDEVTFDVFDVLRNGGFKNKAQLCIKIGENVKLAGFGAFNPKTQKLKSANGFFAGVLAAPTCETYDGETCEFGTKLAQVFAPCALTDPVPSEAAIVYGRWTMTYRADKVRQIEKDNNYDCLYPTGFDGVWPF